MSNTSKNFSTVFFEKMHEEDWNNFCEKEKDAWFWHTADRIQHVIAVAGKHVNNQSFAILSNSTIVAIVPLIISAESDDRSVINYSGWGTPFPVIAKSVSDSSKKQIKSIIFNNIDNISNTYKVDKVLLSKFYQLTNSSDHYCYYNELVELEYINATIYTSVIDLRLDEKTIFSMLRKNHKRDVKKYSDIIECLFLDKDEISLEDVELFKKFYFKVAGKNTHPDKVFDIFYKMIGEGNAMLVRASINDVNVGYVFLVTYKRQVYYLMGAQVNNDYPVVKVILYKSMVYLRQLQFCSFEVGRMEFESSPFLSTDAKRKEISSFKKGFGGDIYPIHQGVKYYNENTLNSDFRSFALTAFSNNL